ncbi:hypothetical protein ACFCZ1_02965 [Streptomyces sp. NPDC056224]|uniref:hypothetical protein n=1 Tax=Streptomyces sp. NPDC056224 TaxID=3345750 RepID=UPI0035D8A5BF
MPAWTRSLFDNLRYLLNEWDPIGVADLARDEYDCMLGPLFQRLRRGTTRAELGEFLRYELEEHFGLDPADHGTDAMADRLIAWWAEAVPTRGADGPTDQARLALPSAVCRND